MDTIDTGHIIQIIGVGYTFTPSLAVRRHRTQGLVTHHSSQERDFTYFQKGAPTDAVGHLGALTLRRDPATGSAADHWPEAELAMLLGASHTIEAYTLGNDFTAHSIEMRGRSPEFDSTYHGKVWRSSCALGPRWFSPSGIDVDNLDIGLRIERDGKVIYDHRYNTGRRRREFSEIPDLIVRGNKDFFGTDCPPSKEIILEANGRWLPPSTVIVLGTGLIVAERFFSKPGDILTVYSPGLGELINRVAGGN